MRACRAAPDERDLRSGRALASAGSALRTPRVLVPRRKARRPVRVLVVFLHASQRGLEQPLHGPRGRPRARHPPARSCAPPGSGRGRSATIVETAGRGRSRRARSLPRRGAPPGQSHKMRGARARPDLPHRPSVDLHRTALDAVHALRSGLHVGAADHDAAVAPQGDARLAAAQDDLVPRARSRLACRRAAPCSPCRAWRPHRRAEPDDDRRSERSLRTPAAPLTGAPRRAPARRRRGNRPVRVLGSHVRAAEPPTMTPPAMASDVLPDALLIAGRLLLRRPRRGLPILGYGG